MPHPVSPPAPSFSRRRLTRVAAWAVPTATLTSVAAPALAVSGEECGTGTFEAPAPAGTRDADQAVTTEWTVPAGVSVVCFEVAGAGGGGSGATTAGGSGGLVTGRLAVTAGQVLTLVVAAGGARLRPGTETNTSDVPAAANPGGGGYGDGGDVLYPGGTAEVHASLAGSGGGASAILLGGTPLVVAGGGGGGSGSQVETTEGYPGFATTVSIGGAAEADGVDVSSQHGEHPGSAITAIAGQGGAAGVGGAGGATGSTSTDPEHRFGEDQILAGEAGGDGFEAAGGDGIYSVTAMTAYVSAGGGGGYGGGGSAGITSLLVEGTGDEETFRSSISTSGSAGGGGNYVAGSVLSPEVATAGNGGTSATSRPPGSITITF